VTFAGGWLCKVCWKSNLQEDRDCFRCGTPRDADDEEVEARRADLAAAAAWPDERPDIFIALPVVIFRGYAWVWQRGGIGMMVLVLLIASVGVTDPGYLVLTGGLGVGIFVGGVLAGEVSEGMHDREVSAFVLGIVLAFVGVIGWVLAFETLAPDLASLAAVRWGSVLLFGGAGIAAIAGLLLLYLGRDRS